MKKGAVDVETRRRSVGFFLLVSVAFAFGLAAETVVPDAPATERAPAAPDPVRVKARIDRDRLWFDRHLASAYELGGHRDPKWDADALAALSALAAAWSGDPQRSGNEQERAWQAAEKAVRSGCGDPLVRAVRARMYSLTVNESTAEAVRMHRDAVRAMAASDYAPVLVATAHLRAAEVMIADAMAGGSADARDVVRQLEAAKALLPAVAADFKVPSKVVIGLVEGILEAGRQLGADRQQEAAPILELFAKARDWQDALVPLLRASFLVAYAWDARGNESGAETTSTRHRVFAARMEEADKELAQAVALDPLSPSIAPLMLAVELGQGRGRPRMESWFAYGVAVDPGTVDVYMAKLHYLEPSWYGSAAAMLDFGRQCVAAGEWALKQPLVLGGAHFELAYQLADDMADYFAGNGEACADVRHAYEPFLERFPDAAYERSAYALMLYHCGDYTGADRHFRTLGGDGRVGPFDSRAHYESVRIDAAARALKEKHR
ncbi:MAG: hypothetical protein V3T72_16395 [Thermoanaerobaculia bacterium]